MLLKETIRRIVISQKEDISSSEYGLERELLSGIDANTPYAIVLSGVRRCGKSTLLRQMMKKTKKYYYFNFEDPRAAGFELNDFQRLEEVFREEYGAAEHYFFDEIQNVGRWELFVRSMLDKGKKFVITGSNASLLSRELGTRLTGRHLTYELFPFSFTEFLGMKKEKPSASVFWDYLKKGGFPEFLKYGKNESLQMLLSDIIARDIVVRHRIKDERKIKAMATYLLTNTGKEFSYNSLKKTFGIGSVNSAIAFVSYFEDSYLLFTLPKFDYSLKKQIVNPKKVYSVDNGLSSANSASFSDDNGRVLENSVFLHLRRQNREIFYFREKSECDFLVREKSKITRAIQVCYGLNEDNKEREIKGLQEAMSKFNLNDGLILTYNQEDRIDLGRKEIKVLPAWKWMLEK